MLLVVWSVNGKLPVAFARPATIKQAEPLFGLEFKDANLVGEDWRVNAPQKLAGALYFCREELHKLLVNAPPPPQRAPASSTKERQAWPGGGYECFGKWEPLVSSPITDAKAQAQWQVWLCRTAPLRGVIRLKKALASCAPPLHDASSGFSLWNKTSDERRGPEDFVLTLEGHELQDLSEHQRHLGECHYETRFALEIPGRYRLHMLWMRTGHLATKPTETWPDGFASYPLGSKAGVFLDFAGDSASAWDRVLRAPHLPTCSANAPPAGVSGRWVLKQPMPRDYFKPVEVEGRREQYVTYVNPEDYTWVPRTCRLLELADYVAKCEINRLSLFGDSHGRIFFQGLLAALCGGDRVLDAYANSNPWKAMEFDFANCTHPLRKPGRVWTYSGIFSGADWEQQVIPALRQPNNRVLANFGQHLMQQPSSYEADYEKDVLQMLQSTAASLSQQERDQLTWFQTPVMPHDLGGFVRGYRDGRSAGRVALFNELVDAKLGELGVPVAPLLGLTLPFLTSFTDRAHFPKWVYVHTARVAFSQYCSV